MRTRGVSLLEMLIAISIIMVLIALAFPAYSRALGKAIRSRDACNEHYRADNPKWTFDEP